MMYRTRILTALLGALVLAAPGALAQTRTKKDTSALKNPRLAKETAPEEFTVEFQTTKGSFKVKVTRKWAPNGADRFYNLVKAGYYADVAFFRVVSGFMAQFGIHGDPEVYSPWAASRIKDDPVVKSNLRGYVTFAKTGQPNSRTVQCFINYGDNSRLDGMGFAPFGIVLGDGMKVVDKLYSDYGDGPPYGTGPEQSKFQPQGNKYLEKNYPKLDYIKKVVVMEGKS